MASSIPPLFLSSSTLNCLVFLTLMVLGKVLTISSAQSQMAMIECYPSSADDLHYGRVLKDSEIHLDGVETLNCEL